VKKRRPQSGAAAEKKKRNCSRTQKIEFSIYISLNEPKRGGF
jgi:hypothetical protein